MSEGLERQNLPGEGLKFSQLFEPRVGKNNQELGVRHPSGKFYRFQNGEKFAQVQITEMPGDRVSIIIEMDGRKRLFDDWASEQESLNN